MPSITNTSTPYTMTNDEEITMSILCDLEPADDSYAHLSEGDPAILELIDDLNDEVDADGAERVSDVDPKSRQVSDEAARAAVAATPKPTFSQAVVGLGILPFYMVAMMRTLTREKLMRWRENRTLSAMLEVGQRTETLDKQLDALGTASNDKDKSARLDQIMRTIDLIGAASYRTTAYCGRSGNAAFLRQFRVTISDTLKSRADMLAGVAHREVAMPEYLDRQLNAIVERIDMMLAAMSSPDSNRRADQHAGQVVSLSPTAA